MYIVPPTRPHRSLIGQPIIGVGSLSSYSTSYTISSSSSPTSNSSSSNTSNTSRSRRTKSSNTYYSSDNGLSSSNTSFSRYPPCPPAYENRRLRRRDAFGVGEAAALTTRTTPISMTVASRRKTEMPIERIPAVVREGRRSRYDNYYHIDEEVDDYYEGRYPREHERGYRYSRRHGESRLRSFSEHARSSGRQELIDLMGYAYDDDDISSWTRYCRTC
jgi:hypothetical protein